MAKQLDLMLSKHLKRLGIPKKQWPEAKQSLLDFGKNVLAIESTNDYGAINKKSGAKGGYQFLDNSIAPAITRLKRDIEPQDWMDEVSKNKDARTLTPEQQDLLVYGDLLNKTVGGEVGRGDRYLKGIIGGDKESALRMYYEGHHTDPESQKGTTARARAQFGLPVENNRSGGIVGNMEMQYRQPAQGLAALGRGPDTELVHMTPNEVQGLQSLAQGFGGSLTTNPDTGLPEAGFLSNILPMLIGGGLAIATGGLSSAFINPWTIGGAMGLGGLAASGGDLKQGLKYGLGGFGGASLAGSLAGAGAAQAGATGTGSALGAGAGTGSATTAAQQTAFNQAALGGTSAVAKEGAKFGITGGATTGLGNIGKTFTSTDALGRLATDPLIKRGLFTTAAGMAAGYTPPKQEEIEIEKEKNFFPEGGYQTNRTAQNVAPLERDSFGNFIPRTSEATYFNPNSGGITQVNPNARNYYGPEGTEPNFYGGGPYGTDSSAAYTPPSPVKGPFGIMLGAMQKKPDLDAERYNYPVGGYQYAAQGGLMGFADGGLTRGPGDGMSDDIMTSISGQQAAALSPGEFVVPADVVSDMGNGDTGAGAKQLYAMMDRVRKARGGSIEQPDAINPNEYMPA
jgi:hypothetical protein